MICPNCQTDSVITEHNHGALYTCPHCQAVYFINFEGQPEYGEVPDEMPPIENVVAPQENAVAAPAPTAFDTSLEPLIDSVDVVAPISENALANAPVGEAQTVNDILNQQLGGGENFPQPNFNSSENLFVQPVAEPSSGDSANPFSQVAQEISQFGNQEVQLAGLNYDLKVFGLDTQELRSLFKEAIEDSRFGWDAETIMKQIKNGEVELDQLNPVKAYILAKRLQFIDIEKKWKQNVLD